MSSSVAPYVDASTREGGARRFSRRTLLKRAGIGAGAVAVVSAGGLAWRIVDQGVLAPGSGIAYEPWQARLTGDGPLSLVRAATLAANAHNTQPWLFRIGPDRIDLFADRERSMGALDPLGRELEISLGCALENLLRAAPANGFAASLTLLPDPSEPDHIAGIDLRPGSTVTDPLFEAIPRRHTDRGPYAVGMGVDGAFEELSSLADDDNVTLTWLRADPDMATFARLTVEATEAIVAASDQARDDFAWYRQDWGEIQRRKDGITMDAAGLPEPTRLLVRILPSSDRATLQQGWVDATRDRHVATAAAFGLISVQDAADTGLRIGAGRLFQRIHLASTTRNLALQPLNQVFERTDAEIVEGNHPSFTDAVAALAPSDRQAITAFRIGHPTGTPNLSPRRPAEEVLVG